MTPETMVGTIQEHGHTRRMREHDAFEVSVSGQLTVDDLESAKAIESELRPVLAKHGIEVRITPVKVDEPV